MSNEASAFTSIGTPQLVERFIADATRIGLPRDRDDPRRLKMGTPEHDATVKDLHAVARELCARKPIAEVQALYENENAGVRTFASTLLSTVDPQLSAAAFRGLAFDTPARQVVALARRARTPPPESPSLADMTLDALIERFIDVATRLFATRFLDCVAKRADLDLRNRIVGEEGDILRELKARGALERLLPLLDGGNPALQPQAAIACLAIASDKAIAILEAATRSYDSMESRDARHYLHLWREGKTVVSGVV
jgi:hypothetical protein